MVHDQAAVLLISSMIKAKIPPEDWQSGVLQPRPHESLIQLAAQRSQVYLDTSVTGNRELVLALAVAGENEAFLGDLAQKELAGNSDELATLRSFISSASMEFIESWLRKTDFSSTPLYKLNIVAEQLIERSDEPSGILAMLHLYIHCLLYTSPSPRDRG